MISVFVLWARDKRERCAHTEQVQKQFSPSTSCNNINGVREHGEKNGRHASMSARACNNPTQVKEMRFCAGNKKN